MALLFNAYTDRFTRTGLPTWNSHSGCMWARFGAATGGQIFLWLSERFGIYHNDAGSQVGLYDSFAGTGATHTLATGTWAHLAWEHGGGVARLWLNGVEAGTTLALAASANNAVMYVGGSDNSAIASNVEIEGLAIWDGVQLGTDYWSSQKTVRAPLRLANLWGWWPWIDAATPGTDLSGTAHALTAGSTGTDLTQGPPVPWRGRRTRLVPAVVSPPSGVTASVVASAQRPGVVASAQASVTASLAATARRATLAAAASVSPSAVLAMTAPRPTASAQGTAAVQAALAATLRRPTLSASASAQVTATLAATSQRPALTATATVGAAQATAVMTGVARRATMTATATLAVSSALTLSARRPTMTARASTYAGGPVVVVGSPRAVTFDPTRTALALDATRTALALDATRTALTMEA